MPAENLKREKPPDTDNKLNPPQHEIEAFARCIFPAIQAYFESEEGQREFADWKARQKFNQTIR